MKKSEQYSNKALTRGSIRRLFTVPVIISIVLFTVLVIDLTFYSTGDLYFYEEGYTLIEELRQENYSINWATYKETYTPYYHLAVSFGVPAVSSLFGMILAALQFNFLLNKKSCYTQLSFAVNRKRLFTFKTLIPLLIPAAVIVIVNIIVFILNAVYIGASLSLLSGVLLSVTTSLMSLIFGYTATVAGHLFAARRVEAYIFTYAIINVSSAISSMTSFIFPETLYGYSLGSYYDALELSYYDYSYDMYYGYDYYPVSDGASFVPAIASGIVALLVMGGILALFKLYFVKKYKAEQSGVRGKSRIVLIISCVIMSLSLVHSFSFVSSYIYWEETNFVPTFIICIIASVILCIIICLLATFSPKKLVWGATAAGLTVVLHLVILGIGVSGGFGYATRIPDADEIESVEINLPFNDMYYSDYYNENTFFLPTGYYTTSSVTATSDKDIEIVRSIHKTLIENREEETGVDATIYYTLENGSTVSREYENISVTAADEMLNLWETEEIKANLRFLLNQATEEEKAAAAEQYAITGGEYSTLTEAGSATFYSDGYASPLSTFSDMHIISKDYTVTEFKFTSVEGVSKDYTDEVAVDIMGALYKDACTLSAEEWFMPENELGALSFTSYGTYSYSGESDLSSHDCVFYINTNMTNTLKTLEKYGYLKYFDCSKKIAEAHLIDVNEVCDWIQYYEYYEVYENHGTYFSQSNTSIERYLIDGCGYVEDTSGFDEYYDGKYYDEYNDEYYDDYCGSSLTFVSDENAPELNPTAINNEKEIRKLLNDAYLAYNVGNDGKFLVIKYSDGTCNMLVVPNK